MAEQHGTHSLGRARDLHADLTRSLEEGAGTDRTTVVLVQATDYPDLQVWTADALLADVPGASVYDLGGGELAVVGGEGVERSVARVLRPARRAGVRWGAARWPEDATDPALVVDVAASRIGRTDRRAVARRGVVGVAAALLVAAFVAPVLEEPGSAVDVLANTSIRGESLRSSGRSADGLAQEEVLVAEAATAEAPPTTVAAPPPPSTTTTAAAPRPRRSTPPAAAAPEAPATTTTTTAAPDRPEARPRPERPDRGRGRDRDRGRREDPPPPPPSTTTTTTEAPPPPAAERGRDRDRERDERDDDHARRGRGRDRDRDRGRDDD